MNNTEKELLQMATDLVNLRLSKDHTVGAVVKCKDGKIYKGINMYMDGMNCVCAEQNAVGTALTDGNTEFEYIACMGKFDKDAEILSPCGQCRQFLSKYAPDIKVIVNDNGNVKSVSISELLPYAYKNHMDK